MTPDQLRAAIAADCPHRLRHPASPDRYDRILHAIGSSFETLDTWPDHPRALETLADAVEQLLDAEVEASQRRAIRIQTLLDDTRDRVRKIHRNDGGLCTECSTDQRGALWPCNTVDALEPLKETQ